MWLCDLPVLSSFMNELDPHRDGVPCPGPRDGGREEDGRWAVVEAPCPVGRAMPLPLLLPLPIPARERVDLPEAGRSGVSGPRARLATEPRDSDRRRLEEEAPIPRGGEEGGIK